MCFMLFYVLLTDMYDSNLTFMAIISPVSITKLQKHQSVSSTLQLYYRNQISSIHLRPGVFNLLSFRANLHLSHNPAGSSH